MEESDCGSQLIVQRAPVYQTIRHHEYNYGPRKYLCRDKKTDSEEFRALAEQRRQHIEEQQVFGYCWVIAGL